MGLVALTTSLCCLAVNSEIPINKPFQVVRPTANHSSMLPVIEGLQMLARHDSQIAVVSVVGPYHSGKSFLLNALAGEMGVFQVGRRTNPETMGIWLCRTNLTASDGSEVFLMDSEGFFGPGVDESYDAKIFTIASLLGGHLVYNTVKVIDQQAATLLELLARRAQLFRTRSAAEPSSAEAPEFLSVRNFPPLTWVVEDFVQEMPEQHRSSEDPATAWLRSYLSKANTSSHDDTVGAGDGDHLLSRLYSALKVHTLFLPATEKQQLQDLSKVDWEDLTKEFKAELLDLRQHVLSRLQARQFDGHAMRGPTLERALRFITQALQRGMFAEMPSLWATWNAQVAQMSLQDAETWFSSLLTHVDSGDDPIPLAEFNQDLEAARAKAMAFYRELLRDFDIIPEDGALRERFNNHFRNKLTLYHERVHRWVGQLIEVAKDVLTRRLAAIELPIDPTILQGEGDNITKSQLTWFSEQLVAFSQKGPTRKLGRAATMPAFTQDPLTHLTSDLRHILSSRELENEKEIAHFFKDAVQAAEEAVESELRAYLNRLLGRAKMKDLQTAVASKCWQAFEEKLVKHKWLRSLPHYRQNKALVQTDAYDNKMTRFGQSNHQKLSDHFRTVLERCKTSYRARKANMVMPASETDLEAEHQQLSTAIRDMLDEQAGTAGDLKDTDAYRGAVMDLNAELEEGLLYLRQKNIELWKVHSDEATRCALRQNEITMKHCGLIPPCLFNKVPQVHKSTSRANLMKCFSGYSAAARMSPAMQMKVFENWYNKDLAQDAANVWNNFYIGSLLIGLLVVLLFGGGRCCGNQQAAAHGPFGATGGSTGMSSFGYNRGY